MGQIRRVQGTSRRHPNRWLIASCILVVIGCSSAEAPSNSNSNVAQRKPETDTTVQISEQAAEPTLEPRRNEHVPTPSPRLSIIEIPTPNSGTYTDEEATALLPKVLARAAAVSRNDRIVTEWQNPYLGFRVHVSASDKIETTFNTIMSGDFADGIAGVQNALNSCETFQQGNPLGILLSSDTPGWDSEVKRKVIDVLFQPSIQLYLVASPETDAAKSTEQ